MIPSLKTKLNHKKLETQRLPSKSERESMYISEESHVFLLSSYLASNSLSRQLELADYTQREERLMAEG